MKERTTLVIAHRLSTIKTEYEIIVLNKGKVAERGNHSKLIKLNGSITKNLLIYKIFLSIRNYYKDIFLYVTL